jgi:hypothetical protein
VAGICTGLLSSPPSEQAAIKDAEATARATIIGVRLKRRTGLFLPILLLNLNLMIIRENLPVQILP